MAYDNTNRGSLNKNERKEKPTHADYRGQINVGGKEYWLDAWLKDGPKGKWMSLSVKPKDDTPKSRSTRSDADEDSPPF
jgi:hypothetical protein